MPSTNLPGRFFVSSRHNNKEIRVTCFSCKLSMTTTLILPATKCASKPPMTNAVNDKTTGQSAKGGRVRVTEGLRPMRFHLRGLIKVGIILWFVRLSEVKVLKKKKCRISVVAVVVAMAAIPPFTIVRAGAAPGSKATQPVKVIAPDLIIETAEQGEFHAMSQDGSDVNPLELQTHRCCTTSESVHVRLADESRNDPKINSRPRAFCGWQRETRTAIPSNPETWFHLQFHRRS